MTTATATPETVLPHVTGERRSTQAIFRSFCPRVDEMTAKARARHRAEVFEALLLLQERGLVEMYRVNSVHVEWCRVTPDDFTMWL